MIRMILLRTDLMTNKSRLQKLGNLVMRYLSDPNEVDYFAVVAFVCTVGVVSFLGGVLYGFTFGGF